jgi:hypothetical protein
MKKTILLILILVQSCIMAQGQVNLSDGLFACYPFSGDINDKSGQENDLMASGGGFTTGRFGNISAWEFNGTDDYLTTSKTLYFSPRSSVSFWVCLNEYAVNDFDNEYVFLGLGGYENYEAGFGIHCQKDSVYISSYFPVKKMAYSNYKLQPGKWYHIVVTANVGYFPDANHNYFWYTQSFRLYINDTIRRTGAYNTPCSGCTPQGYKGYLQLGSMKCKSDSVRNRFFNGKIDDVMFYNRELNSQEIHALYTCTTAKDVHPALSMASVNESDMNFVTWKNEIVSGLDSIFIYRESQTQDDKYDLIGKVPYSAEGIFIDSSSNAALRSDKYLISYKDFLGDECEMSPGHKTIHLKMNKGIGFDWNLEWEEYSGLPVENYMIYRGASESDLSYIDSVNATDTSYTYTDAPSGIQYYQVRINLPVDSSNQTPTEYTQACSNIMSNFNSFNTGIIPEDAIFFPNPAENLIYIRRCDSPDAFVNILSLDGRVLLKRQLTNDGNTLDISFLDRGVYLVRLTDSGKTFVNKLIKK